MKVRSMQISSVIVNQIHPFSDSRNLPTPHIILEMFTIIKVCKGELQHENNLMSSEKAFKIFRMIYMYIYIAGISQAVLESSIFKVESGNHQRRICLLRKFSDIFGGMRLVPLKMTSHLTSHNFRILKIEIFSELCKI